MLFSNIVSNRKSSRALLPLGVFAGYVAFGALTLSRQYTYDAISYLWDIENTHLSIPLNSGAIAYNFFHSQHLFFSLFPYIFYHAWSFLGYSGSALFPAQVLNLLEGGITLSLLFTFIRKWTNDDVLSLMSCMLLGCTYAFWNDTAMISDHMPGCLLAMIYFNALCDTEALSASPLRLVMLGCLNGAALLMHQVNGLLGVLFLVALWSEKIPIGRRFGALAVYSAAAVATVGIPYAFIGIIVLGNTEMHDFIFWCFYYAMPGVIDVSGHYGTLTFEKIGQLFTGFGASVIGGFYWMNRVFEIRMLQRYGVPLLSALAAVTFLWNAIQIRRRPAAEIPAPHRRVRKLAASWFAAYALLLFWWGPWYYQLWAVPFVGGVIYLALWMHGRLGQPIAAIRPGIRGFAMIIVMILAANSIAAFLPSRDADNNDYLKATLRIKERTVRGDLIVLPGNDEYDTYIPYFAGRNIVSLHAILIDRGNDLHASLMEVRDSMEAAWDRGKSVFVVSELRDTVKVYKEVYDLHHLSNAGVAGFFRRFPVADTIDAASLRLYRLRNASR